MLKTALAFSIVCTNLACSTLSPHKPALGQDLVTDAAHAHCDGTLLVLRPGVEGAEHVDSERLQLLSRDFAQRLQASHPQAPSAPSVPEGPAASSRDMRTLFDVTRIDRSEVLRIDVVGNDLVEAKQLCDLVLEQATAVPLVVDTPATRWLSQQKEELQTRRHIEAENLRRFFVEHAIVTSLDEEIKTQAQVLRRLQVEMQSSLSTTPSQRERMQGAIEETRERARRLQNLQYEERALRRQLDTTEAVLRVLETRQAELRLERHLNPTLRIVDNCSCKATQASQAQQQ